MVENKMFMVFLGCKHILLHLLHVSLFTAVVRATMNADVMEQFNSSDLILMKIENKYTLKFEVISAGILVFFTLF